MIELKNLTKVYKGTAGEVKALENINLTIKDGEIFGIIGLSGAGKSTLVRCINLLERPTGGDVLIDGKNLMTMKERELLETRRSIGMIFQGFNLLEQRTVLKNVCYPLEIAKVKKESAIKKAKEMLKLVGLSDKEGAYPSQLSGGQKQRVAIAGVLALKPEILVLDESTAMLDPKGRKEILAVAEKLKKESGVTVITITHYMDEAALADRIYVLNHGETVMSGTPKEIFEKADELKACGLELPYPAYVAQKLKEKGFPIEEMPLSEEELAERLVSICE